MTLGTAPRTESLLSSTTVFCQSRVAPDSIYALLHRECDRLFPDEAFADLFCDVGRRSVPPRIVAVVMVLQRLEGLSDRDAVERFCFDARWKFACGGLDFDYPEFVHTVLVDFRERLRRSDDPDRVFQIVLELAKSAGRVGRKRILDSTALYDAVSTMDTVTLIRSAIRGLLRAASEGIEAQMRAVLRRDDDYQSSGKPICDWQDPEAREALIDALAQDAMAILAVIEGTPMTTQMLQAAGLLATVIGQDLEQSADGMFRIVRGVAPDRVISTVDPEARHGHKTNARGFDGYKAHVAVDPDSEIICATAVTSGNEGDASVAVELLEDLLDQNPIPGEPADGSVTTRPAVYGDSAYGTGELLDTLEAAGVEVMVKVQAPHAPNGHFPKDRFLIDLEHKTVTCPAHISVPIRPLKDGLGVARFQSACRDCPLRSQCTDSVRGRVVMVSRHEQQLTRARARQHQSAFKADYKATRPKVERKIAHIIRAAGRRARMRGRHRNAHDFAILAAAVNLARLAILGVHPLPDGG